MSLGDQPAPLAGIDENTWTVGRPMRACQSFFNIVNRKRLCEEIPKKKY